MKYVFDKTGFTWILPKTTVLEVSQATQEQFSTLRDDQLKALMKQVEILSKKKGVELDPDFIKALEIREEIMEDHKVRKSQAEPD